MGGSIMIDRGWWCWLEIPVASPGFGASPVFVEQVAPLKSGKGLLRLTFVQAIHPVAARKREVIIKVLSRTDDHLVGTVKNDDGTIRTAILAAPEYGWLETYCPLLTKRRPPSSPPFIIVDGPPLPGPTAVEYLESTFGRTPADVLRGAHRESFGEAHPPMPERNSVFSLGETYNPFDSWMITRGFVPTAMEEKWFVYMENGRLLFRRSWTGNLIYDVEATWRGDQLYLGLARVNRDAEQYGETDDDYDRRLLTYLIAAVLLGENASFPIKEIAAPEQAALQAWSLAGKASL